MKNISNIYLHMKEDITDLLNQGYTPQVGSKYTVLFGRTNGGKSALINLLQSVPYTFQRKKLSFEYIKLNNRIDSPEVGNGRVSCTKNITAYRCNQKVYIDTAGIKTTEGLQEEMLNTILESRLYLQERRINFILVVEIYQLMEMKGGGFLESLGSFLSRFNQNYFAQAILSTVLVFTKVNLKQMKQQEVIESLFDLTANESIDEKKKKFIQMMIQMKKVKILPRFDNQDCFKNKMEKITQSVNALPFMNLTQTLKIAPSPEIQNLIRKYLNNFLEKLQKLSRKIKSQIFTAYSLNKNLKQSHKLLLIAKQILERRDLFENKKLQSELMEIFHSQEKEQEFFLLIENIFYFGSFLNNFQFDLTFTRINETIENKIFQLEKEIEKKQSKKEVQKYKSKLDKQIMDFRIKSEEQLFAKSRKREQILKLEAESFRDLNQSLIAQLNKRREQNQKFIEQYQLQISRAQNANLKYLKKDNNQSFFGNIKKNPSVNENQGFQAAYFEDITKFKEEQTNRNILKWQIEQLERIKQEDKRKIYERKMGNQLQRFLH